MNINLRDYQQTFFDNIIDNLKTHNKICAVMPTGGGKSIIIAKLAETLPGRTLILTHRIEILQQNSEWLKNASILTAKENSLRYDSDIVISMVQTAHARIKKYGTSYLGNFDNIIVDEVQVLIYEKVFSQYDFKKLIGLTATPVVNKRIYTTIDDVEYVEPYTLSLMFDCIVEGVDSQDLIDKGYLVQDYNISLLLPDFDKLRESDSSPDGYTKQSLNEVYRNTASLNILKEAYYKYCFGKKTLIFNATTETNKFVYDYFKKQGLNVKIFDTINETDINPKTGKPFTRKQIIKWFKENHDAILINVNVFTTGFDVDDVQCVMINRATTSLALWVQMVGRGSRNTQKFLKDYFTVIDLGQNIEKHGAWSERRSWVNYFYSPGKRRKHVIDLLETWDCFNCKSINLKGEVVCKYCGEEKQDVVIHNGNRKSKKLKEGQLIEIKQIPLPKATSILKYTREIGEDGNFAYRLAEKKIVDLFIHYKVSKKFYEAKKQEFHDRVRKIYLPIYFGIMKSELHSSNKKLETQIDKLLTKIEQIYD